VPDYYKDKPDLAQALKKTYEDDYRAILKPGAMAVTPDPGSEPRVSTWSVLDDGQAIPTDVEWALY
jgi:hypothetical protein